MKYPYAVGVVLDHYGYLQPEQVTERLRYSTFVSLPKRYLYFEVPKAACTAIKTLIREIENAPPLKLFIGSPETRRDMFVHARQNVPLPSLIELSDEEQREVLDAPDFFRMTVVRNPYTRLVSGWQNKVVMCEPRYEQIYRDLKGGMPQTGPKPTISLEEFVAYIESRWDLNTCDPHWRRQAEHTLQRAMNFSCIGKVEALGDTLHRFEQHLGRSKPLLAERKNPSRRVNQETHDARLAPRIHELYRGDFDTFGYDSTVWPYAGSDGAPVETRTDVPEEKFRDEIIERNLVIARLYEELNRPRGGSVRRFLSRAKNRTLGFLGRLVSRPPAGRNR